MRGYEIFKKKYEFIDASFKLQFSTYPNSKLDFILENLPVVLEDSFKDNLLKIDLHCS